MVIYQLEAVWVLAHVLLLDLMQALCQIKNIKLTKSKLAKKSIYFEQNVMKEIVGSQDQTSASYGGFNKITFNKDNSIKIKKDFFKKKY